MPRSLVTVLAAVAPMLVCARSTPCQEPRPEVASAWQEFRTSHPGTWLVRWHAAAGTPLEIYGEGIPLADWRENSLAEARRHADAALHRHAALLGLHASDFTEEVGTRLGRTYSFTYAQSFRGVPVVGGRADVRVHMRGRIAFLGSVAFPVPADFDTAPRLTAETATAIAWHAVGAEPSPAPQPGVARAPRLVIWADAAAATLAPVCLAFEIPISAVQESGDGPVGRAYVDARTGAYLHYTNDKHECGLPGCGGRTPHAAANVPASPAAAPTATIYTVMGYLHAGTSPVAPPTNEPIAGVKVNLQGIGIVTTDQNGQFTATLSGPTQATVSLEGVHSRLVLGTNQLTALVTLQPGTSQTIQLGAPTSTDDELAHTTTYHWVYAVNEFARGILGNTPQLAIADQVIPTVNIQSTCNAYYTGNTINFYRAGGGCNNTASASVVAHEWGHGLDDRYGGISQTNGLSEGWGDICSIYLLDDPIIGHAFFTGGGGIRNGNNTRQYPSGGGVHDQGESWMGFAWLLRQNLRNSLGSQQAIAISNEIVLGSIVANAIDQPAAVTQVFIADDDDGNLVNGVPHYAELTAACNSHSLPYPSIQPGYVANLTQLPSTGTPLVPRLVTVDAVPTYGTFTQVRLVYDDGQAHVRDMIPTGTPNRFQALLPGLASPQVMRYHAEAVHSGNATYRIPASGEYSYLTHTDERIWIEDFESGAAGWSHFANYGTDDWEIGVPAGRSGFGWTDPATTTSGTRCAGNDLAADGAYAAASFNVLRSPAVDCTGRTGVRLRFRRWLTCDVGFQDHVYLFVNGHILWTNPQSVIQDAGWTTVDMSASMADNQPAVTIEFRLQSDASGQLGGWNVDDVELYSTLSSQPLPTRLQILPEQATQGLPLNLTIATPASQPFVLVIGDQPGPTVVPGITTLQVGGSYVTFFDYTDASGHYALPFAAPATVPLVGTKWYSQVLTLDANFQFTASNAFVNLFTR